MKNTLLRSPAMWAKYQAKPPYDGCVMCDAEPIEEYKHWKIIWNDFYEDAIANRHHMLVPLRHIATRRERNEAERKELDDILDSFDKQTRYDQCKENFMRARSQKGHFHYHLQHLIRR